MSKTTTKRAASPFDALRIAQKPLQGGKLPKQPDIQPSEHLDGQILSALAKSKDPAYMKFTTYISRETHLRVKSLAVQHEVELSGLVEELLKEWLAQYPGTHH
jgi:hypothetical protein